MEQAGSGEERENKLVPQVSFIETDGWLQYEARDCVKEHSADFGSLGFAGPTKATLTPGAYENAQRYPFLGVCPQAFNLSS
jgi:hypothetical protein